ncbi:MAG: hypothetical protein ACYTAO_20065 [Planctomycetota bacterium]|jgi:hypothetical protein
MALRKMRWLTAAFLCLVVWPPTAQGQSSAPIGAFNKFSESYARGRLREKELFDLTGNGWPNHRRLYRAGGQLLMQGCEGDDMRGLLSDRTELSWRSNAREIGMWHFTHFARLTCDSRACTIDAGLRLFDQLEGKDAEADVSTMSSPVSPSFANGIVTRIDLVGEKAARMYEGLGVGSFDSDDGSMVFVWVDYGYIAEMINVRARGEIHCYHNENRCSVYDQILVFIPYGKHDSCG